jgi:hypothetical protein
MAKDCGGENRYATWDANSILSNDPVISPHLRFFQFRLWLTSPSLVTAWPVFFAVDIQLKMLRLPVIRRLVLPASSSSVKKQLRSCLSGHRVDAWSIFGSVS